VTLQIINCQPGIIYCRLFCRDFFISSYLADSRAETGLARSLSVIAPVCCKGKEENCWLELQSGLQAIIEFPVGLSTKEIIGLDGDKFNGIIKKSKQKRVVNA
jgi:hypothetical protein